MGVARWSSSMPTPTAVRMSGSARTTTYVSAAVTRTARVARTTTDSPGRVGPAVPASAGGRCGDLDIVPEVAQPDGEGGVGTGLVEGPGQLGPAQLAALRRDRETGLDRLGRVLAGEDLLDELAGDPGGHLADHLAADPLLLPQLGRLGLGQELGDAGVGV